MKSVRTILGTCLAVILVGGSAGAADQMPWQPSVEAAQQIAARTNRLVLLHFWSKSCRPCLRMDSEVFSRPEVARSLETNFVMVKLNVDEAPGTARMYGVSSIPSDVITLPNGQLVSQMRSPPGAGQYIAQMSQAAAGHRSLAQRSSAQTAAQQAGASPPSQNAAGNNPPASSNAMAQAASTNDRYADYFPQQQQKAPAAATAAGYPANPATQPPAGMAQQNQAAAGPAGAGYGAQAAPARPASYRAQLPQAPQLPAGSPPLALDGYCPVTLLERQQWAMGDARFGAIHRGRTYLFLGPNEVKKFLADPEKYAPVLSGNDPVLALDNQQMVPGRREYGVYSDNRVYLFANEKSRQRFEQNPGRYAAQALQAAVPGNAVR